VSEDPERVEPPLLGHRFRDGSLLRAALTHPSWAVEHGGTDNERLEFLGDSVLSFVVAEYLYVIFPDVPEGVLTKMKVALTSGRTLSEVARGSRLQGALRLGRGATRDADRDSVLENTFEAVVGAIYLDAGIDAVRGIVLRALADRVDPDALLGTIADSKTRLQELTQSRGLGLPVYDIVDQSGPPHEPIFTATVHVAGALSGSGCGATKQAAEQAAAEAAVGSL
jgi:ribonuclease-3